MFNVWSATLIPKILGGFVLGCCLGFIPSVVQAATANSATLQWAANSEPDLAGYKVYQGTTAGSYGPSIDVKNVTTYTASNLQGGLTYSFAITAYDLSGNESYPSNEVTKYIADSSPDLTPLGLPLPSQTNGTTLSGLVTNHEIADLAQDFKETTPPAGPSTFSTTVTLAEQPFTATDHAVTVQPTETSLTNGTTLFGLVTNHEIIDQTQDLKETTPPAGPSTFSTTVTLAEQPFTATDHAVTVQPTEIILNPGITVDQATPVLERNIQIMEVGKQSVRRTMP
jgi:hypothetical protein